MVRENSTKTLPDFPEFEQIATRDWCPSPLTVSLRNARWYADAQIDSKEMIDSIQGKTCLKCVPESSLNVHLFQLNTQDVETHRKIDGGVHVRGWKCISDFS